MYVGGVSVGVCVSVSSASFCCNSVSNVLLLTSEGADLIVCIAYQLRTQMPELLCLLKCLDMRL